MLILIMCNPNGETYQLSENLESLKEKIEVEKETGFSTRIILAKVKLDVEFGFGSGGNFFAEEIIEEWYKK